MPALIRILDNLAELLGKSIAWLTLLMMLVTCIVVVARYLLNMGSIAIQESVMYMHGVVFMLGIGYTLKHQNHVRVDIIYQRMSPRVRAVIDIIGTLIFLFPVSSFIFFASLDYVALSWSFGESSAQPGGLPGTYVIKALIPTMAFLLFLQGFADLLRNVAVLRTQ